VSKIVFAALVVIVSCQAAVAADYDVAWQASRRYQPQAFADFCHVERCGPNGCRIVDICHCPARYTCRGLYDAYGPFGGYAFMSAYTRY
jgi:hypothetical protein